ncbi:hypothetical protein F5878DRAFT_676035 [Lentinula raphanica]|uniref:DNase I-like protein n=1 Tax=Lentinula raphanica TaxID=153919 RepID=A0AA38U2U8_9AGAR|nr:hypothetical protein F5878DRAFT_676035 [Lentinula raphanica]
MHRDLRLKRKFHLPFPVNVTKVIFHCPYCDLASRAACVIIVTLSPLNPGFTTAATISPPLIYAQVQQQQELIAKARQEFNDFQHSFTRSLPRSLPRSLDSVPPINVNISDSLSSSQPSTSHEDPREQNVEPSSQRRKTNAGNRRKSAQAGTSSNSQSQSVSSPILSLTLPTSDVGSSTSPSILPLFFYSKREGQTGVLTDEEPRKMSHTREPDLSKHPCTILYLMFPCNLPLIFFLLFTFILPCVCASVPFRTFALNADGLGDVMKINTISNAINFIKPHAWVINKTKSSSPVLSRLHTNNYKTFESVGLQHHSRRGPAKWGVGVGIHSNFQCQQIPVHDDLQGRVVTVDIVIPTMSGRGFIHRLIGLYAPFDPGERNAEAITFWNHITDICLSAPYSWSFIGDCNLTLTEAESSGADREGVCRELYNQCLNRAHGSDIWTSQGVLEASIEVFQSDSSLPGLEFASRMDTKCRQAELHTSTILDDRTFEHRYVSLTNILEKAANETFHRRQLSRASSQRKLVNPRIRLILRESHRINRLIYATKSNQPINEHWVSDYYTSFLHDTSASLPPTHTPLTEHFLHYLKQSRRSLARLRYQEEKAELQRRTTTSARSRINNALLGGSIKKLYPWNASNGPPRALIDPDNPTEFSGISKIYTNEMQLRL